MQISGMEDKGLFKMTTPESTNRFTREAPIIQSVRLIHYCFKDGIRQYLDVCKARGCKHLRPLRPLDEGSCLFRPKKERELKKRADKKNKLEESEQ